MKHDPKNPDWEGRDYFILSKGHGSLALYAVLAEAGYFPESELNKFCSPLGILGGEPHALEVPGIEASTGSLGHGLSVALGIALALKHDAKPNKVFCMVGDGECQEGSVWEAIMAAPSFEIDNLYLIVDNNSIQKMDFTANIIKQASLAEQIASFGWDVRECDGHNIAAIHAAVSGEWQESVPRCLVANTVKGKGLSLMENNPAWHWRMPSKKERKVFCAELGITEEELIRARGER
jgi:transketolase